MLTAQSGALSVPSHPLKGSGYFSDSYTRPWAGEDSKRFAVFLLVRVVKKRTFVV